MDGIRTTCELCQLGSTTLLDHGSWKVRMWANTLVDYVNLEVEMGSTTFVDYDSWGAI